MLSFDTTPAAALPATPAPAGPGSAAQKGAGEAFGDLLSLLTAGAPDQGRKKAAPADARGGAPDQAGMPLAVVGAVTAQTFRGTPTKTGQTPPGAGASTPPAPAPGNDEQALADNLKWLLTMASAPKPDAAAPMPAVPPGGSSSSDTTAGAAMTVLDPAAARISAVPGAADPIEWNGNAVAPGATAKRDAGKNAQGAALAGGAAEIGVLKTDSTVAAVPGVQLPGSRAAATTYAQAASTAAQPAGVPTQPALALAQPAVVPSHSTAAETQTAGPTGAPSPAPPNTALPSGPPAQTMPVDPAVNLASADRAKAPAVSAPLTTVVPAPVAESRLGDGGSAAKRDARGGDDRSGDAPAEKVAGVAQSSLLVPVPTELRAPSLSAPAAAEAATPSNLAPSVQADLPGQIVQAIRMQWADGVGDARITLQPEYLGELSIAIRVEHGSVTASLESNTASVREWIDANQPMLRQALAQHGLQLDRLTVTDQQPQPGSTGNPYPEQKQPQQQQEDARQAQRARRRNDEDAPVFEMMA